MKRAIGFLSSIQDNEKTEKEMFQIFKEQLANNILEGEYDYLFGEIGEFKEEGMPTLYQIPIIETREFHIYRLVESGKEIPPKNGLKKIKKDYIYSRKLRNPEKYGLALHEVRKH